MTANKEWLLKISNLNVSDVLKEMNSGQLDEYVQMLNSFIESYPAREEKIKTELAANDYDNCRKSLLELCDTLKKIHADILSEECTRRADSLKDGEDGKSTAHVTNFLAAISALSADIQMAMIQKDTQAAQTKWLMKISNLNVSGIVNEMDDSQLKGYIQLLNVFIESYPDREEKIKTDLAENNYASCAKRLSELCDVLKKIHADVLAEECMRQADSLKDNADEKSAARITNFLAAVSALSIDVQMEMFKKGSQAAAPLGVTENSILAVDDVAFFLSTLKSFLGDTNCKLTCVTSGEAALRFIRNHKPDLFLLDIDMPGMDGYLLARKIRENGQNAPIIFLTGNATKSYVVRAIEVGAVDFIVKPINREQLLEKIGKYISLVNPGSGGAG